MSSIERRRRAWAALKLGPLWQPVEGLLPHAPIAQPSPVAPPAAYGRLEDDAGMPAQMPPPDDVWQPAGAVHDTPEGAWLAMAAEAEHYASTGEPILDEHDVGASTPASAPPASPDPMTVPTPVAKPMRESGASAAAPRLGATSPATHAHEATAPESLIGVPSGTSRPDRSLPDALRWQQLREAVSNCHRCGLADTRQNTVFGRGQTGKTRWMLIGEAPGAEEDRRGEAFVGQAGQLLDAMLSAVGIDPATEVFIANVLKCRPPGNRNPELHEVNQCEGYLHEQIRLADPDCILLLGRFAAQSVLNSSLSINRLRHRVHHIRLAGREVPVVCTFHPAYLLRNPLDKLKSWEDLCLARSVLTAPGDEKLPLPPRRSPSH
ncbi:MAG: uracil-DNA glycosylase family protein [Lautropia sp.]|nr:uracil-DNA glycosylase family protein [Lautropia sp.]